MSSESEIDGDDGGSARGKRDRADKDVPVECNMPLQSGRETHVGDSVWKQDGYDKYKVRYVGKKVNSGWIIHVTYD
jgi:hypothetical protein